MKNMQHMLYLYTASSAMSLFLASLIEEAGGRMRSQMIPTVMACVLLVSAVYVAKRGNVAAIRSNWLTLSSRDHQSYLDLQQIFEETRPTKGIGVLKKPEGYNVFHPYGPGFINNLILGDADIKTFMIANPTAEDRARIDLWLNLDESTGKVSREDSAHSSPR